jgi:hypothetical protein
MVMGHRDWCPNAAGFPPAPVDWWNKVLIMIVIFHCIALAWAIDLFIVKCLLCPAPFEDM